MKRHLILIAVLAAMQGAGCALGLDFDGLTFAAQDTADVGDGGAVTDAGDAAFDASDAADAPIEDAGTDADQDTTDASDGGDAGPDVRPDVPDTGDACVPSQEICDGVDNDCDGLIDDDDRDVQRSDADCGRCGNVCGAVPGGVATCVDSACVVETCATDRADLDGNGDNGCEFARQEGAATLGGLNWVGAVDGAAGLVAVSTRAPVTLDLADPGAPAFEAGAPHVAEMTAVAANGERMVAATAGSGLVLFDLSTGAPIQTGATTRQVADVAMSGTSAVIALDDGAVQRFDIATGRFVLTGNSRPVGASTIARIEMAGHGRNDGVIAAGGSLVHFVLEPTLADPIDVVDDVVALLDATPLDLIRVTSGDPADPAVDAWWMLASTPTGRSIVAVQVLGDGSLAVRNTQAAPGARSLAFSRDAGRVVVVGDDGTVWRSDATTPTSPGALVEIAQVDDAQPALTATDGGLAVIGTAGGIAVLDLVDDSAGVLSVTTPYQPYTDVALSADGDLLAGRGAAGVTAAPPGAVRGSWSTQLSFAVTHVSADAELGAVIGAGGEVALLRRLGPGRWSAVDQLVIDAPSGATFSDVEVRGTRVWVAAGRAGVYGFEAMYDDVSSRWTLSRTPQRLQLPDPIDGLQLQPFADLAVTDDAVFARGSDRVWGFDLSETSPIARLLVLRNTSGAVINTRAAAFALDGDGRVHFIDPSLGLVGFVWQPTAEEPFALDTPLYLDAVSQRPWTANDRLTGRDGWFLRTAGDAGWAMWLSDEQGIREARLATEDSPWVSSACPTRSAAVRGGVAVIRSDCGIVRVVFAP